MLTTFAAVCRLALMKTTLLRATYRDLNHRDPNIKGNERILEVTQINGQHVRIVIKGEPFMMNDPFVVVSDVTMPLADWATHRTLILDSLTALNATILVDKR
jgi:hypothetical protein